MYHILSIPHSNLIEVVIIDVRSPSEFNEDHVSGAINLPVLSDEEFQKMEPFTKSVSI